MFSHTLKYVFFVNNGDPWNPRPETVVHVKALQIRSNSFNHIHPSFWVGMAGFRRGVKEKKRVRMGSFFFFI